MRRAQPRSEPKSPRGNWIGDAHLKSHLPFPAHRTAEQDKQVEALRAELTDVEEKLREANEMELPEEDFRVAADKKREDLNNLVKGFHEINLKEREARDEERKKEREAGGGGAGGGGSQRKFERPSERRARLDREREEGGGGGRRHGGRRYDDEGDGEDAYASFGGRDRRGGGGGYHEDRGSRGGGGDRYGRREGDGGDCDGRGRRGPGGPMMRCKQRTGRDRRAARPPPRRGGRGASGRPSSLRLEAG